MEHQRSTNEGLRELALFAGAGGGILGGHLLGWRTICAVEYEPYPAAILIQRQNDGILQPFPIWDDVRTFDGKPWRGLVDVVSGGFPCQDISSAGTGKGITGERSGLWKEMARIIGEVRPPYVLVENSPMLIRRGLAVVLGDLASMGYDARWGVLGAHHAGAPHKRDRIWIHGQLPSSDGIRRREDGKWFIGQTSEARPSGEFQDERECLSANTNGKLLRKQPGRSSRKKGQSQAQPANHGQKESMADSDRLRKSQQEGGEQEQRGRASDSGQEVPDPRSEGLEDKQNKPRHKTKELADAARGGWWAIEPRLGRVVDGFPGRVDRLKAIGNAQVSSVAALAWNLLTGGTA